MPVSFLTHARSSLRSAERNWSWSGVLLSAHRDLLAGSSRFSHTVNPAASATNATADTQPHAGFIRLRGRTAAEAALARDPQLVWCFDRSQVPG
jgi:hypothetical protein